MAGAPAAPQSRATGRKYFKHNLRKEASQVFSRRWACSRDLPPLSVGQADCDSDDAWGLNTLPLSRAGTSIAACGPHRARLIPQGRARGLERAMRHQVCGERHPQRWRLSPSDSAPPPSPRTLWLLYAIPCACVFSPRK